MSYWLAGALLAVGYLLRMAWERPARDTESDAQKRLTKRLAEQARERLRSMTRDT